MTSSLEVVPLFMQVSFCNSKMVGFFVLNYPTPLFRNFIDDAGILLFDADGDNDLDLYTASGGAENEPQSKAYVDHFYTNDGKGNFKEEFLDITNNRTTKSILSAYDYDNDGDLDLFVGGRVIPGSYPSPTSSFIYQNESSNGKISFTDVTKKVAPSLQQLGMVT